MNTLGCNINIIANKLKRQIEKDNQIFGVSAIQGRIIQYIERQSKKNDVFQKDLELEFELRGASLSSTLQNLESQELIIREPLKSDQRLKRIVLTDKALDVSKKITKNIINVENNVFKVLTVEEQKLLHKLLGKIIEGIKEF